MPFGGAERSWNLACQGDHWFVATWDDTVVTWWGGTSSEHDVRRMHTISMELAQRHPGGICSLAVVDTMPANLDPAVRQAAARVIRETEGVTRCRAVVVSGNGFLVSALRGLLIGFGFFRKVPSVICSEPTEAVQVLAEKTSKSPGWAYGLERALDEQLQACRAIGSRRPA